jgi:hypothetical protein
MSGPKRDHIVAPPAGTNPRRQGLVQSEREQDKVVLTGRIGGQPGGRFLSSRRKVGDVKRLIAVQREQGRRVQVVGRDE